MMLKADRCRKNELLAGKRSFESNCEIWRTIFQARALTFRYTNKPESLPLISEGRRSYIVPAYFLEAFVFLGTEVSTSFLISLPLVSVKRFFSLFSMTN